MNLDLLIKLVKLANNNPSEHEANSAARKVCRMIAENNYNFGNSNGQESKKSEPVRTWADVKRSDEPFWKSTVWENEFWSRYKKGEQNKESDFGKYYNNTYQDESSKTRTEPPPRWRDEPLSWDFTGSRRGSKTYHQKYKTCTVCFTERLTTIDDEPYVCGQCKWKKYQAEKGE